MPFARTLLAALALTALPAIDRCAAACSCAPPPAEFEITPSGGAPVPLNARVRVAFRGAESKVQVTLRAAAGRKVAVREQVFRDTSGRELHELTPQAPLRPETDYTVVVTGGRPSRPKVATARFRTGRAADTGAPQWRGIEAAVLVPGDTDPAHGGLCHSYRPYGHLKVASPIDPESSPVVFAVWLGPSGAALAYDRAPVTYVTAVDGHITIGDPSKCGDGLLPWQDPGTRVGLRAVDQAGNLSPPSETRLTLQASRY